MSLPHHTWPRPASEVGRIEPVPRRVRAMIGAEYVVDTTAAVYLWEHAYYPQFYLPEADVSSLVLEHPAMEPHLTHDEALPGYVKIDWDLCDAWFEEDEEVFVHPRSPYVRVDALRSSRHVAISLDGVALASSSSTVMVFETGLPTRYYFDRTAVDWSVLVAAETQTPCPYKGRTSAYWSVRAGSELHEDLAWCYDFPTRQLLPIAGLVAFYNEKLDIQVDGVTIKRPKTKFS